MNISGKYLIKARLENKRELNLEGEDHRHPWKAWIPVEAYSQALLLDIVSGAIDEASCRIHRIEFDVVKIDTVATFWIRVDEDVEDHEHDGDHELEVAAKKILDRIHEALDSDIEASEAGTQYRIGVIDSFWEDEPLF